MNGSEIAALSVVIAGSSTTAALIAGVFQRRKIKAEVDHLSADAAATLTRTATELIDPYRSELRAARSEVSEAREEVSRLRKQNRRLHTELEETRSELKEARAELADARSEIHQLHEDAEGCRVEIQELRAMVTTLQSNQEAE